MEIINQQTELVAPSSECLLEILIEYWIELDRFILVARTEVIFTVIAGQKDSIHLMISQVKLGGVPIAMLD